jgi:hypothetical protein
MPEHQNSAWPVRHSYRENAMNAPSLRLVLAMFLSCAGCIAYPQAAHAAQSYDNCNNFIDTLPATISTQGVWCLRHDLSTNITGGNAITISANNVTIDCNDFKLGGLAAGAASQAVGIFADGRQNATLRHCNLRGFYVGIVLSGGAGHLVEDNRLDNNLFYGMAVWGEHSLVRRNRVFDTGGAAAGDSAVGISAYADIIDNTIVGVFTDGNTSVVEGILAGIHGTQVSGNRIRGLALKGDAGTAYGIELIGSGTQTVSGNRIVAATDTLNGSGIKGLGDTYTFCTGNFVARFSIPIEGCLTTSPDNNMSN